MFRSRCAQCFHVYFCFSGPLLLDKFFTQHVSCKSAAALTVLTLLLFTVQDEMEELRSEMLEMRDMYMEEDVYQLQELRQQLEQVYVEVGCKIKS